MRKNIKRKIPKHIADHKALIRSNAAEGTLFLKKDGNFPLVKAGEIALFGNGVRNTVKGGTGSGDVNCFSYNNCEQAFEEQGFTVTTKKWLDAYDKDRAEKDAVWENKILERIRKGGSAFLETFGAIHGEEEYSIPLDGEGEACLYVLARNSGEGMDRLVEKGNVYLTDTEIRDILCLNEKFERFMLVLNVGGVVDLSPVNSVKNILLLSQLGVSTGDILADIVSGKANPSGKLAATWAKYEDYPKIGEFGEKDDTRYKEGVFVGYRYFDTVGKQVLYPFGFGLSYSEFSIECTGIYNNKSKIYVQVSVGNTGDKSGKEVVQIYVTSPCAGLTKPAQVLASFQKSDKIAPGRKQELTLSFDIADIASYDEKKAAFVLEKGKYVVQIGNSSRDTFVAGVIDLDETIVTEQVKNALGKADFEDIILSAPVVEVPENAPLLTLCSDDFAVLQHDYHIDEHINPVIKKCTDEQLMHLCVGAYLPKSKLSVLGSSACHVAGASGETTNYAPEITDGKYLVLADGPAGLRISSQYIVTPDGKRNVYDKLEGFLSLLPVDMKKQLLMRENVHEEDIIYQDTTAIPIATAIAQSWNPDVAEQYGNIVGTECELYHCHFWLAPAMNIQRNILCGRNFEYYSEDPLLTGKIAAGLVRGLQSHKGIGATIKHFCANNQETNRYNNNSIVSERALREIYLKGFEICVKESSPKAVMTSYNLLNAEHTSQRQDLLDGILRGEWGYKGFVMTDWITTGAVFDSASKYPGIYAHKVVSAGNDIVTPGGDADFEDLKKAFAEGKITRERLEICATRIYEAILENNA